MIGIVNKNRDEAVKLLKEGTQTRGRASDSLKFYYGRREAKIKNLDDEELQRKLLALEDGGSLAVAMADKDNVRTAFSSSMCTLLNNSGVSLGTLCGAADRAVLNIVKTGAASFRVTIVTHGRVFAEQAKDKLTETRADLTKLMGYSVERAKCVAPNQMQMLCPFCLRDAPQKTKPIRLGTANNVSKLKKHLKEQHVAKLKRKIDACGPLDDDASTLQAEYDGITAYLDDKESTYTFPEIDVGPQSAYKKLKVDMIG